MKSVLINVCKTMIEREIDCLVLADADNIFYISDLPISKTAPNPVLFTLQKFTPSIAFVTPDERVVLLCDSALAQQVEDNASWIVPKFYPTYLFIDYEHSGKPHIYAKSLREAITNYINESGLDSGRFGVDFAFSSGWIKGLAKDFPNATWIDADRMLREVRMVKTQEEIARIRVATEAAYCAMEIVRDIIESGQHVTEKELFTMIRSTLVQRSCQWNFTSVGAGAHSADIYHQPGHYEIKRGDTVRLDIGAVCQGYGTDVATTFFVHPTDEKLLHLYHVLNEAQSRVIQAIKPGVRASDLFYIGQEYVRSSGYPHYTRTMIGHGVGIETEEDPFISPQSSAVLTEGMVLAIEIPFYIKHFAGLNTEDLVLITSNGCELLSNPEFKKQKY